MSVAVARASSRRQPAPRPLDVVAGPARTLREPSGSSDRPTAAGVAAAVAEIRAALDDCGARCAPDVVDAARAGLRDLDRRLALGLDRTVVALVGGTGSGKSSLVNAISGLAFAEVGDRRPTTAQPAACLWGGPADALLDALGVPAQRRTRRESLLDGRHEDALRGLVLLDLPDTDSVETAHAADVERILPLVDLLVWVVDPQKYADTVLHQRYLRAFAARRDATVVLVNQVDTVTPAAVGRIADDVARLLEADGLADVPVLGTSAVTGAGIAEVRAMLTRVVATGSARVRLAAEEARTVAALLAEDVGGPPAQRSSGLAQVADDAVAVLAEAAGLRGAVAGVRSAVERGRPGDLPVLGAPSLAAAAAVREQVVAEAGRGLRRRWREALDSAAGDVTVLWTAAGEALAAVETPPVAAGRGWRAAAWTTALLALVAVVAWAAGGALLPALTAGLAGVVAVVGLSAAGRAARRRAAIGRAAAFESYVRAALADVVGRVLVAPLVAVRAQQSAVRARLAAVPELLRG